VYSLTLILIIHSLVVYFQSAIFRVTINAHYFVNRPMLCNDNDDDVNDDVNDDVSDDVNDDINDDINDDDVNDDVDDNDNNDDDDDIDKMK